MGRLEELVREGKYPNPVQYYDFLSNKVILNFRPRFPDQTVKEEFKCVLSKNMKYEQVLPHIPLIQTRCVDKGRLLRP
jgi:hypothetical protein